jgi:hypothetical protein
MAFFQRGNIAFVDRRAHGLFALCDRSPVLRISPTRFPTAISASAVGRIANYLSCLVLGQGNVLERFESVPQRANFGIFQFLLNVVQAERVLYCQLLLNIGRSNCEGRCAGDHDITNDEQWRGGGVSIGAISMDGTQIANPPMRRAVPAASRGQKRRADKALVPLAKVLTRWAAVSASSVLRVAIPRELESEPVNFRCTRNAPR